MKITNLSNQAFLFKNKNERFKLSGREILKECPEWIAENSQALRLKKQQMVTFEVKVKPKTRLEELKNRADELGIVYGDGIKEATLEKMVEQKEKELKDGEK